MRNRLFSYILVLLLVLGLFLVLKPQKEVEVLERRKAFKTDDISLINLSSDLDEVLSDQFIGRDKILTSYHKIKNFSSSILNRNNYLEAKDKEVIDIGNNYLINNVYTNDYYRDVVELAASRAYNIKQLSDKYQDLKVYVYKPTRIEETNLLYTDVVDSPLIQAEEAFKINLGTDIVYKSMKLESIEDYQNYFYKTDIHWNSNGSYVGYKDIIDMISQDFNLEATKQINDKIVFDYPFYGHYANKLANILAYDYLEDLDLGINEQDYKYYVDGKLTKISEKKNQYRVNDTIYSAYDEYFLDNAGERIFKFNNDKPNILIFADSFINTNAEWIASHFNNTVIIDLRNYQDFKIDDYLKKYDIEAILVMEYYENLYVNGNMYIPID